MREIDMSSWSRRKHFEHFMKLDYPHFNVCANVDITKFKPYIKEKGFSFFVSVLYVAVRAANEVKEFRYRIRDNKVIEHDVVHPSFTVMSQDEAFSFCMSKYYEVFDEFNGRTSQAIELRKEEGSLDFDPLADEYLYMTSLPWISFTSISHPMHLNPVDSVPRIAWGKFFDENDKIKMPLSVHAHHALVDGFHAGRYFEEFQKILDNPEKYLG